MSPTLLRLLRVGVSVIIAGVTAQYGGSDWYLTIAPVLSAIAKYLRGKYGWNWLPI